jgi:hypothetical protein
MSHLASSSAHENSQQQPQQRRQLTSSPSISMLVGSSEWQPDYAILGRFRPRHWKPPSTSAGDDDGMNSIAPKLSHVPPLPPPIIIVDDDNPDDLPIALQPSPKTNGVAIMTTSTVPPLLSTILSTKTTTTLSPSSMTSTSSTKVTTPSPQRTSSRQYHRLPHVELGNAIEPWSQSSNDTTISHELVGSLGFTSPTVKLRQRVNTERRSKSMSSAIPTTTTTSTTGTAGVGITKRKPNAPRHQRTASAITPRTISRQQRRSSQSHTSDTTTIATVAATVKTTTINRPSSAVTTRHIPPRHPVHPPSSVTVIPHAPNKARAPSTNAMVTASTSSTTSTGVAVSIPIVQENGDQSTAKIDEETITKVDPLSIVHLPPPGVPLSVLAHLVQLSVADTTVSSSSSSTTKAVTSSQQQAPSVVLSDSSIVRERLSASRQQRVSTMSPQLGGTQHPLSSSRRIRSKSAVRPATAPPKVLVVYDSETEDKDDADDASSTASSSYQSDEKQQSYQQQQHDEYSNRSHRVRAPLWAPRVEVSVREGWQPRQHVVSHAPNHHHHRYHLQQVPPSQPLHYNGLVPRPSSSTQTSITTTTTTMTRSGTGGNSTTTTGNGIRRADIVCDVAIPAVVPRQTFRGSSMTVTSSMSPRARRVLQSTNRPLSART